MGHTNGETDMATYTNVQSGFWSREGDKDRLLKYDIYTPFKRDNTSNLAPRQFFVSNEVSIVNWYLIVSSRDKFEYKGY